MKKRLVPFIVLTALLATIAGGPAQAAGDPGRPNCKRLVFFTDSKCVEAYDWYDGVRALADVKSSDKIARAAADAYGPYATSYQKTQMDDAIRYYGTSSAFRTCFRTIVVNFAYEVAKQRADISAHKTYLAAVKKAPLGSAKTLVTSYAKVANAAYNAYASATLMVRAKDDITNKLVMCAM